MPKLNEVLAEWDDKIDEKIEDAKGVHETVNAIRSGKGRSAQPANAAPPDQVSSTDDSDDSFEEIMDEAGPAQAPAATRSIQVIVRPAKGTLVVELSERSEGNPVAARLILKGPVRSAQKVTFHDLDASKQYTAAVLIVGGAKPIPAGRKNVKVKL